MKLKFSLTTVVLCIFAGWQFPLLADDKTLLETGRYIFTISGCTHCHTAEEGELLAGGRPLETPFGTFYGPNITPDETLGIGRWSREDLKRSLRHGLSPQGEAYYPAFPYPAYTLMSDADMDALYAYLMSVPAVAQKNKPHELVWYLRWRLAARIWQQLFVETGAYQTDAQQSAQWNRGAYIVEALAHCGECHTPRNKLGVLNQQMRYAGNPDGPEDELVPNITPHPETGIGDWSEGSLNEFLRFGELPDGEYTSGSMEPVIEGTGKLTQSDRQAVIEYLRSLPAIDHQVKQ